MSDPVRQAAQEVAKQARGHRPGDPVTEAERDAVRSWLRALGGQARKGTA